MQKADNNLKNFIKATCNCEAEILIACSHDFCDDSVPIWGPFSNPVPIPFPFYDPRQKPCPDSELNSRSVLPSLSAPSRSVFDLRKFNVSHRLNRISFGEDFPGAVQPLDGVSKAFEEEGGCIWIAIDWEMPLYVPHMES